jgi:hypothetical protein
LHSILSVLSLFATTAALLLAADGETPESVEAAAELEVTPAAPLVTQEGEVAGAEESHPFFGVQGDVGLPDGAGASLLVMPVSWMRLHVGGLATLSGSGARAGVTLVAFPKSGVRPMLGVEGGYAFSGNATWVPYIGTLPALSHALEQVSYGWGSAHVGFELGSPHFSIILRGGLSYIDLTFAGPRVDVGGATLTASSMSLRGVIPSARVGLMIAF